MPQGLRTQNRAPRSAASEAQSLPAPEAPSPQAPALADSSAGSVPAVAPLEFGRGGQEQDGDQVSRVYETRADRRRNAGREEGERKTRSYSVHRPEGDRGSFTRIHGHENDGDVFERPIGYVNHEGTTTRGR